jgi:hypothetical protein
MENICKKLSVLNRYKPFFLVIQFPKQYSVTIYIAFVLL